MPIVVEKNKTSLKLEYDGGMVGENQKLIRKTFNKVDVDATDEAIYETAKILETLQNKEVVNVKKVEEKTLSR